MTKLPESGQLTTNEVRDHFRRMGRTSFPADYYRGQMVPDMQQLTGSGFRSNDTGARFQVLRLFVHDNFNSGSPEGSYSIDFDTSANTFADPVTGQLSPDANATDAMRELREAITAEYPVFEFSQVSHHTAQASSIEINCANARIQSGAHTIYLNGNFMNSGSVIAVPIPAGSDAGGIADAIETALNSDLRTSLFGDAVVRNGNEIELSSTGGIIFWMSDESADETFTFSTDTWESRPRIRELEPEIVAAAKSDGSPAFDIGSNAGLSVLINTMQNENPTNSAVYSPDPSSVDYWLELTTVTDGTTASATDHIVRIAIEDDFNAGVDLGDYPNNVDNCVELTGFDSITHTGRWSMPTGGVISNRSDVENWATPVITGGNSNADELDVAFELPWHDGTGFIGPGLELTDDWDFEVSLTITDISSASGSVSPEFYFGFRSSETISNHIFRSTDDSTSQLGEHIITRSGDRIGGGTLRDGFPLVFAIEADGTFTYTINYIRITTNSAIPYKPAGDYPVRDNSIAAVQFTQGTFPTGEAQSIVAGGQLDGPIGGWIFHPRSTTPHTILFEREFGGDVDLTNGRIDVSIDIISLPVGFNIIEDRITIGVEVVNTGTGSLLWDTTRSGINTTGPHVFDPPTGVENALAATVAEGDSLSVTFYVDDANHRGFTYNVDYVRISDTAEAYTPTGGPASFTLDMDTGDTVFDGDVVDDFAAGDTATEALQHVGNLVRDQFAQITTSSVTDYTIANALADLNTSVTTRQTGSASRFEVGEWDLRESPSTFGSSFNFTSWGDFVNRFFIIAVTGSGLDRYEPIGSAGTITVTDADNTANFATFEWRNWFSRRITNGWQYDMNIRALASETQTAAPTSGALDIVITDDGDPRTAKQIQIHTNQIQDLTQTFRLTTNTATDTLIQVSEFAVGGNTMGPNSSYTITDPSGSETMSLTGYSRENLASISSRIREAVNDTTDMPTDFTANVVDGEVLLKPASGLVANDWSITVNHGSGNDGTINYSVSRPNSFVPTSGQMSFPDSIYNTENGETE